MVCQLHLQCKLRGEMSRPSGGGCRQDCFLCLWHIVLCGHKAQTMKLGSNEIKIK